MTKKILSFVLTVILISNCFLSCSQPVYEVEYPEYLTWEYCMKNYKLADPNLLYLYSAQNGVEGYDAGVFYYFYAIKDVPCDRFLFCRMDPLLFSYSYEVEIWKNKQNQDDPIRDYTYESVQVFWKIDGRSREICNKVQSELGNYEFSEFIHNIDPTAFRSYLLENLDSQNYLNDLKAGRGISHVWKDASDVAKGTLAIRVSFEEYENIVWDAYIMEEEGTYFIECCVFDADWIYYDYAYIPFPEEWLP